MNSIISKIYSNIHDSLLKQVQGCGERCPCCKRICDVDHHLDVISPIGQGENRHRCQSGHQIRGMGGIRYKITAEASMAWCEIIKDDDPLTTNNNMRQTWKTFKNANADWDFGDPMVRGNLETCYFSIWKRIGRKLCDHFGNGMKFVEKNSPPPINHFILLLDHSGSMNEKSKILQQSTPWEKLLQAIKVFVEIRIQQVSLNDRITAIVFANRAERIYNFEKLKDIDIEQLKISMQICGEGTKYSTAFQMAIKTLEETNNHQERNRFRQTIIFMTDGEPQDNSTAELQKLCDWREGSEKSINFFMSTYLLFQIDITSNQNDKALINNFWTMALGKFNKTVIEEINQKIHGKLVNIENPDDLVEAYAQVAEII